MTIFQFFDKNQIIDEYKTTIDSLKKEIEGLLTPKEIEKKENNQLSFFSEKQNKIPEAQSTKRLEMSKQIL